MWSIKSKFVMQVGISFLTDDSSDMAKNWSKKTFIIWPAINYLQNQKAIKRQKI